MTRHVASDLAGRSSSSAPSLSQSSDIARVGWPFNRYHHKAFTDILELCQEIKNRWVLVQWLGQLLLQPLWTVSVCLCHVFLCSLVPLIKKSLDREAINILSASMLLQSCCRSFPWWHLTLMGIRRPHICQTTPMPLCHFSAPFFDCSLFLRSL